MFFDCDVIKLVWQDLADIISGPDFANYESAARIWISNKKNSVVNMITSAVL